MDFENEFNKTLIISFVSNLILALLLLIPRLAKWEEFQLMSGKWVMILLFFKATFDIIYFCICQKNN